MAPAPQRLRGYVRELVVVRIVAHFSPHVVRVSRDWLCFWKLIVRRTKLRYILERYFRARFPSLQFWGVFMDRATFRRLLCLAVGVCLTATISWSWASRTQPRFDQEATSGEHLLVGDVDATPLTLTVEAGGELIASELKLGDHCRGYISKASTNVRVYFEQPDNASIEIVLESAHRNALIINGTDGQWHCAQSDKDHKTVVRLDALTQGQIDIWAANFSETRRDEATLTIRSITP